LTFERTADLELVRSILTHPRIYRHVGDDFAPAVEDFRPLDDSRLWYVVVRDRDEVLGLLLYVPRSAVMWEAHISMLPAGWGRAVEAAAGGFRWMWSQVPAVCFTAMIPVSNPLACRVAEAAGMELVGRIPRSFARGGRVVDQLFFSLSRQ
jgi:RimJ/RimL family protein N-acetyltransferase